ncbi:MAG: hypothetical protein JWM02_952 [Frankiales bacterium]|nr:hypothetical protein [Frankiales bacterium]
MSPRPAAGGGRWVMVSPERLPRWLEGFAERHGTTTSEYDGTTVTLTAADGARALVEVPFPPLSGDLVAHAQRDRTVGVLLVRLGGHAAGVFRGPRLVTSKVGSRQVHGRSAAGGWSQQRFARRREGQVAVALRSAADVAVRILLPHVLDAVVVGGERTAVEAVLADRRLEPLRPLVTGRLLDVPDPRQAVLEKAPYRDVWIRVIDPPAL